jgi:hypothetical protein
VVEPRGENVRWLAIVVAVLGLALVGVGCGGDDDSSASGDTTEITDTTTTDETITEDTTTDDDDDDLSGLASEDCLELAAASAGLGQAFATPGSDFEGEDAFRELADDVPDEIRDDWQILADAYSDYAEALADIDLSAGETPDAETLQEIQQAIASIDQASVTEASNNIAAWAQQNCPSG